jgi:hypothetical protein
LKIRLEPSLPGTPDYYPRVEIELPNDDLELGDLIDYLIVPALRAVGYAEETIRRYVSVDGLAVLPKVAEPE